MSIIKNINESLNKLKILINEAPIEKRKPYDTDKNRARAERANVKDPSEAVKSSWKKAMEYADLISSAEKMNANNIILNTLKKGANGAVDATFINDLDSRWLSGQRVTNYSNKTNTYDYIIQMLCCVYNMTEGQKLNVGDQEIPIQSGMKQNAYDGLLRMFDLQDRAGRWRHFIFGSEKYSLVDKKYRPRVSTRPNGSLDFQEVDKYMSDINMMLRNGGLRNVLKKREFYEGSAVAYVMTTVRNKYLDIKRMENAKGDRATYDHGYEENPLDIGDPTMLGLRPNLVGINTDKSLDISDVGRRDNGANPGHNSPKRFVGALKGNIKGKGDLDFSDPDIYSMADHIIDHICSFVDEKFGQAPVSHGYPVIPDLFRATMTQDPTSLNFICRDEKYKEIYPNAYAAYLGKPANYAQITYNNWQKKYFLSMVAPEFEKVTKQYIDHMNIDMEDPIVPVQKDKDGVEHAGIDFTTKSDGKEKLTAKDYADPRDKGFVDYDHYYNSLEENDDAEGSAKEEMMNAVMSTFMQLTAPK